MKTELAEFATPDYGRQARCGVPEVIYGAGKSAVQIIALMRAFNAAGENAFVTRVSAGLAAAIQAELPQAVFHAEAGIMVLDITPPLPRAGKVAIICAGTSDLAVAEEAAVTAERLGASVARIYDVGVAGLHRLLSRIELLGDANAVVVVAGMEGALPSVVGGLIDKPLIAVPTSVGYGASFHGLAALLGMLNSCAAGVTVVNIDNGFGAGVAAAKINRLVVEGAL